MASKISKDSEVHITFEDQQQINTFARHNARLQDIKEELTAKQKELQNLEDAADELLMLEDEDAAIPYQVGEVFINSSVDDTNKMLDEAKEMQHSEIAGLEKKAEQHKQVLNDLKVKLYAKFGSSINLEAEEE
ncbi:Prefoldin subunit 4 [Lamellibrachia satsuma]|nr:Prefoldin subunit 4 [Lamellibrachia satsuma]